MASIKLLKPGDSAQSGEQNATGAQGGNLAVRIAMPSTANTQQELELDGALKTYRRAAVWFSDSSGEASTGTFSEGDGTDGAALSTDHWPVRKGGSTVPVNPAKADKWYLTCAAADGFAYLRLEHFPGG